MRKKAPYIVISFDNTTDAMAIEAQASQLSIPGRTIPLPPEISAGCGIAWAVPIDEADGFADTLKKLGLAYSNISVVELYSFKND